MGSSQPVARFSLGVDYGGSPDPTAITVVRMHRFTIDKENFTPGEELNWSPYLRNTRNDHLLYDVIFQEIHYDLPSHILAERLRELAESPLFQTPAELNLHLGGAPYKIQDKLLPPHMGIDATAAGQRTYEDMRLFGIPARGYHLTSGFEESRGKKGMTNIPKLDLFSRMIAAWQRGWIRVAQDVNHAERLREELLTFRWKSTKKTNQLTVEHDKETDHDDLLTALSCAIQAATDEVESRRRRVYSGNLTLEAHPASIFRSL